MRKYTPKYSKFVSLTKAEFAKKWQECLRKRAYPTRELADNVKLKMQLKQIGHFESLQSYKCRFENHWHVGHGCH